MENWDRENIEGPTLKNTADMDSNIHSKVLAIWFYEASKKKTFFSYIFITELVVWIGLHIVPSYVHLKLKNYKITFKYLWFNILTLDIISFNLDSTFLKPNSSLLKESHTFPYFFNIPFTRCKEHLVHLMSMYFLGWCQKKAPPSPHFLYVCIFSHLHVPCRYFTFWNTM